MHKGSVFQCRRVQSHKGLGVKLRGFPQMLFDKRRIIGHRRRQSLDRDTIWKGLAREIRGEVSIDEHHLCSSQILIGKPAQALSGQFTLRFCRQRKGSLSDR